MPTPTCWSGSVPEANHLAWQLGHLIVSETRLGAMLPGARYPELPAGFTDQYTKETSRLESTRGYLNKAGYLDLFNQVRKATLAAVSALAETDLDKPNGGPMAKVAPTLGHLVLLVSNHTLMHGGQAVVVRRKLGKPILI